MTFLNKIWPNKNLVYKKRGSWQHAYTGPKAAEAKEAEQYHAQRRDSIEQGR